MKVANNFLVMVINMCIELKQFIHPKLAISFAIWLISYAIMGIFGGSVAFYMFPRVDPSIDTPQPLPDIGYNFIPYFCPLVMGENIQSIILLLCYVWITIGALFKTNNQGRLALQQFFHLNSIIFLLRTTTVGMTGLPQPNPRCVPI